MVKKKKPTKEDTDEVYKSEEVTQGKRLDRKEEKPVKSKGKKKLKAKKPKKDSGEVFYESSRDDNVNDPDEE